jgi:hypothetical protein
MELLFQRLLVLEQQRPSGSLEYFFLNRSQGNIRVASALLVVNSGADVAASDDPAIHIDGVLL